MKQTKYFSWLLSDKSGNPSCFPSKQSDEEEPCVGVKIAPNKGGQQSSLPLLYILYIAFSVHLFRPSFIVAIDAYVLQ